MTNERTIEPSGSELTGLLGEATPTRGGRRVSPRVRAALPVMKKLLARTAVGLCVVAAYLAACLVLFELVLFGWTR